MGNPFLDISPEIKWSLLRPDHIKSGIDEAIALAQEAIDSVIALDDDALTFENTFLALESSTERLEGAWSKVQHLDSVNNSPELREAYNEVLPIVSAFYAKIPLIAPLWEKLKVFSKTEKAQALTGIQKRYFDEVMADFREAGADLPQEEKMRLEALEKELSQVTQKYAENVLDSTNDYELIIDDKAKLAGLPPILMEQARLDALGKGHGTEEEPKWRFSLQMHSFGEALKYLDDESIRKELWEAGTRIGHSEKYENEELILKILRLRGEKAKLLGKSNFADYVLSRRMAKDGQKALAFIEDMHQRTKEAFDKEYKRLRQYKAWNADHEEEDLEPWDLSYWSEKMRKERYDFEEEELRPYFSLQSVIQGLFEIAETLFTIRIKERPSMCLSPDREGGSPKFPKTLPPWAVPVEVWHSEVKYYEVYDLQGGLLGGFYADWHPRESKRSGAWMNSLSTGSPAKEENGKREPHIGLMCANLTPPQSDQEALLNHREVETVFHEFGHLLHHILGDVEIKSLNGVNVAWDFVELPSQIMENWCWERESLDFFARHHETNEAIPDGLFDKMVAARNFQAALFAMRQLSFAKMDLELHMNYPDLTVDQLDKIIDELLEDYQVSTKTSVPSIVRRFNHLFSSSTGYAAGYYSYKWAEVLDADAFTRFKKEGVLSAIVGSEFRECILSKGNAEDPAKLFRDFMGRDPNPEALLIRSGLAR